LWKDVRPTTIAFVLGAGGVVIGTILAWLLLGSRLGGEGAKIAAALAASYIGGSINFAATAATLGLAPKLLAGAMAADNIAMALYLAVITAWPVSASQRGSSAVDEACSTPGATGITTPAADSGAGAEPIMHDRSHGGQGPALFRAAVAMPAAAAACWAGNVLAGIVGFQGGGLAFMALAAAAIAAAASAAMASWQGTQHQQPFAGGPGSCSFPYCAS
jgi:Protein of unknown function (DUF819)